MKIIIDTDPGTDDAIAISAASGSSLIDLLGLTIVGGNVPRSVGTRNALKILDFIGAEEVPVYQGASRPLRGSFVYAYNYHGPSGLTARIKSSNRSYERQKSEDFIAECVNRYPGEITIVALGPLTNIARAFRKDPRLSQRVDRIYVMGGAFECPGNVTPWAEFNIYDDPVAANAVFSSGAPVTLVGLDVCHSVFVNRADLPWPSINSSKRSELCRKILTGWFAYRNDLEKYSLCDPLTVVNALHPEDMGYRSANVNVVESGDQLGRTMADYGKGNVNIALEVDAQKATSHLIEMIS